MTRETLFVAGVTGTLLALRRIDDNCEHGGCEEE
jgi:hypothetical protein